MSRDPLQQLAHSWVANAPAWTAAVREQRIESRRLATDAAIVEAVLAQRPQRVLDVGCGEGWLCRALTVQGIAAAGVDASAPLIEAACAMGGADYHVCDYAQLAANTEWIGHYDVLVCNFALMEQDLLPTLRALHAPLQSGGRLLIQTVHPWSACGDAPYRDGWRVETFAGFGAGFVEPMPWFFRTLESWCAALAAAGWRVEALCEPLHPQTGRPASLLLTAGQITG